MSEYISDEEIELVIKFNKITVRRGGEPFSVDREKLKQIFDSVNRDFGAQKYPEKRLRIIKKVSLIMGRISWEQPFSQGNKRTCLALGIVFLKRNGFILPLKKVNVQIYELLVKTIEKFENDDTVTSEIESFLCKYVVSFSG